MLQRLVDLAACAAIALCVAMAAHGTREADPRAKIQERIALEWDAIGRKDRAAYAAVLADDYTGIEVDGEGSRDKAAALRRLESPVPTDVKLIPIKVEPMGPTVAMATYELFLSFPAGSAVRHLRVLVTEVWRKDKEWQLVRYQETRVR